MHICWCWSSCPYFLLILTWLNEYFITDKHLPEQKEVVSFYTYQQTQEHTEYFWFYFTSSGSLLSLAPWDCRASLTVSVHSPQELNRPGAFTIDVNFCIIKTIWASAGSAFGGTIISPVKQEQLHSHNRSCLESNPGAWPSRDPQLPRAGGSPGASFPYLSSKSCYSLFPPCSQGRCKGMPQERAAKQDTVWTLIISLYPLTEQIDFSRKSCSCALA